MNIWTGNGFKDIPADRMGTRQRYQEFLDEILSEPYNFNETPALWRGLEGILQFLRRSHRRPVDEDRREL